MDSADNNGHEAADGRIANHCTRLAGQFLWELYSPFWMVVIHFVYNILTTDTHFVNPSLGIDHEWKWGPVPFYDATLSTLRFGIGLERITKWLARFVEANLHPQIIGKVIIRR